MDPFVDESNYIAEQWLKAYAYTIATSNVDAHLDLVSRRLQVTGLSRDGFLEYREWAQRRRNDMEKLRLLRVSYRNLTLGVSSRDRIRFIVEETIKSTVGDSYIMDKEVVLNLEPDGKWREVEEHIHHVHRLSPAPQGLHHPATHSPAKPGETE
jgi:hypothetical protein